MMSWILSFSSIFSISICSLFQFFSSSFFFNSSCLCWYISCFLSIAVTAEPVYEFTEYTLFGLSGTYLVLLLGLVRASLPLLPPGLRSTLAYESAAELRATSVGALIWLFDGPYRFSMSLIFFDSAGSLIPFKS